MANNYDKFPPGEWHASLNDATVEGRFQEDAINGGWVCEKRVAGEVVSQEPAESIEEAYKLFLVILRS